MSNADDIYESINKDWFYYDEKHDRIYYQKQKQLCEDFINESRKEQHQLIDEINVFINEKMKWEQIESIIEQLKESDEESIAHYIVRFDFKNDIKVFIFDTLCKL